MRIKLLLVVLFVYAALLLPQKAVAQSNNILPCFSITNFSDTTLSKLFQLTTLLSADFNGDGYTDLATEYIYNGAGSVWILRGDGKGSFSVVDTLTFTTGITDIVSADFDNNGSPDLAMTSGAGYVYIALWNGSGSVFSFKTLAPLTSFDAANAPYSICSGDFNKDGNADLAATNNISLAVYLGKGGGAFKSVSAPSVTGAGPVCSDDFNKDGYADLAVVANSSSVSVFLWSIPGIQFSPAISIPVPETTLQFITSGDFNGDGYADLATGSPQTSNVYLELWNTATDTSFKASTGNPYTVTASQLPNYACSGDFNKDGYADLAAINENDFVTVWPGNVNGVFGSPWSIGLNTNNFDADGICSGDFNGDSLPDLATAGSGGSYPLSVLLNVDKFTISGLDAAYCKNDGTPVTITTNINGVMISSLAIGTGSNVFQPNAATLGANPVTFEYYNGCTIDTTVEVTVYEQPPAPTVTSPITLCQGATVPALNATANVGGALNWYGTNATGGVASATAPLTEDTATATYYVSQTLNNCEGPRAAINVKVTAIPPTPIITAAGPTTFCPGGNVQLSIGNPVASPSFYIWLQNGHIGTSITVSVSGNYTAYGVGEPGGCISKTSAPFAVKVDSVLVRIDSLDKEYCVTSDTVFIHGFPSGGTYTQLIGVSINQTDTLFIPSNARNATDSVTTIIYKYTDTLGCSNSDTVSVTIYSAPVVSFAKELWCYNVDSAITLSYTANPSGGTLTFSDTTIVKQGYVFNPSQILHGTYPLKCIYKSQNGCRTDTLFDTLVIDKPNVRFITELDSAYCLNSPNTTLQVSPSPGNFIFSDTAVFNYLDSGKVLFKPSVAVPLASNGFSYSYTDSNGCTARLKDATVVHPFPPRPVAVSSADSICSGQPLNLFASDTGDNVKHYNWTGPALYSDTLQNPKIAAIDSTMSGNFRVQAINTFNCVSPGDSVFVFVKPSPPMPLLYIPVTTICNYNYDSAYIKILSDTAYYSHYNWYLNNGLISGQHQPFLWVPEGGYYTLEVSHTLNNCVTYADTTLSQTNSPAPVVVGLNAPIDSALLCSTGQAVPLNYQWYVNDKTIIGEESKELTVYYNGVYSVFALYSGNCGEFSTTYAVKRYDFSSIARVTTQTDSTITITPPPSGISIVRNGTGANYIVEYTSAANEALTITVTSITGVTLWEKEVNTKADVRSETQINLDGLAPALYILNAATSTQSQYIKIIVN